MSIETFSFPKADFAQLEQLLLSRAFIRVSDNPFRPGPPGSAHYVWWDSTDYRSASGIDGSIYPLDSDNQAEHGTDSKWFVRLRTSIGASSFDHEFQNDTARTIRKAFGGHFENDHYGRNRYIPIIRTRSTPVSRGVYALEHRVLSTLRSIEFRIPEELQRASLKTGDLEVEAHSDALDVIRRADGSRILYNALVPFIVASLEHFFSGCFQILLKYDSRALKRMADNRKVSFEEAMELRRGSLTPEQVAASWFSFQNLDMVHKAFESGFQIDFWKIIRRRRRIKNRLPILSKALQELIDFRHGIVHRFESDTELSREKFLELVQLAIVVITALSEAIARRERVELGPG